MNIKVGGKMGVVEILSQEGVVKWIGIISGILTIISFIMGIFTGKKIERNSINKKSVNLFFSKGNNIRQEK